MTLLTVAYFTDDRLMVRWEIDFIYILLRAECVFGLTLHITAFELHSVIILSNQFEVP